MLQFARDLSRLKEILSTKKKGLSHGQEKQPNPNSPLNCIFAQYSNTLRRTANRPPTSVRVLPLKSVTRCLNAFPIRKAEINKNDNGSVNSLSGNRIDKAFFPRRRSQRHKFLSCPTDSAAPPFGWTLIEFTPPLLNKCTSTACVASYPYYAEGGALVGLDGKQGHPISTSPYDDSPIC